MYAFDLSQGMALRMLPGDDLRVGLVNLAREQGVDAGFILAAVGGLSHVHLRLAGAVGVYERQAPHEILSLNGTFGRDGAHLHMMVADANGHCVGGHVNQGCVVNPTLELVVGVIPGLRFARVHDPMTGWKELNIQPGNATDGRPFCSPCRRNAQDVIWDQVIAPQDSGAGENPGN